MSTETGAEVVWCQRDRGNGNRFRGGKKIRRHHRLGIFCAEGNQGAEDQNHFPGIAAKAEGVAVMAGTKGHSGRKQKPVELKIVQGNKGHRPINKKTPKPRKGKRKAPASLNATAAKKYNQITADLATTGLLTRIDADALALYADAYARYWKLQRRILREGEVLDGRKNPRLTVLKEAFVQMRSIGSEFGWSPATRATLQTDQGTSDDLEKLLK
tara:strand:- start:557 stop:1198 length:642 start_codon:yes stop_codon:yes gene_type:complete